MLRFRHLILAGLATAGLALFAPSAAYAAVTPGAFCKDSEIGTYGKNDKGAWYRCQKNPGEDRGRWRPSGPPPASPDPNPPANPPGGSDSSARTPDGPCLAGEAGQEFSTPGKLYVCQKNSGGYAWTLVTGAEGQPGTLPKTGIDGGVAAGAGAVLLAGGGLVFWAARRRRVRFQA